MESDFEVKTVKKKFIWQSIFRILKKKVEFRHFQIDKKVFFYKVNHPVSKKIVFCTWQSQINKILYFLAKIQLFFFKILIIDCQINFFYGFDLKIGFLGSIYPYPELG